MASNLPSSHHHNSDSSTDNSDDKPNVWVHPSIKQMEKRSLRYKRKHMVIPQPPIIPSGPMNNKDYHSITENETMFFGRCEYEILVYFYINSNNVIFSITYARNELQYRRRI